MPYFHKPCNLRPLTRKQNLDDKSKYRNSQQIRRRIQFNSKTPSYYFISFHDLTAEEEIRKHPNRLFFDSVFKLISNFSSQHNA